MLEWNGIDGEPFEYWIGMFTPPETEMPEHFLFIGFEETKLGVCWIYGKEDPSAYKPS